ncbi:glycosyltransferase family 4 protein [Salinimicrobium sp. WS361]|uniref:glycosyltransferase family 4 protein n=1 Tax=Salinimicrobium sp. WS361 TaxID=3425123 RepID=UPI003D6EED2E
MKILLICHSLRIKSEWLFRLLENYQEEIACIVTNEPDSNRISWKQELLNPYHAKIIRRLDENLNRKYLYPYLISKVEGEYWTTVNYIHFIGVALKVKEFIKESQNPSIIHCHGKDVMWDLLDSKGNAFHSQNYFDELKEISHTAFFIANSTFTKNQLLLQDIPEERIFINHFGKNVEPIYKKEEGGKFKILYLGRLVDFKGPIEVIEAFEQACEMGVDAELIMAGGGELEEECYSRVKSSKYSERIDLLGWVNKEEAENLYRSSDIFTAHNKKDQYTNQVEAFGVTIIEAMSYGLPVITGCSAGVKDSVVHNETGFLIEPGDINTHAQKFYDLFMDDDLRKKMGENARNRIQEYFSPAKEKEGFKNIVRKITEYAN